MAQTFSYDGVKPVIDPGCYVHPTAVVIGDVCIETGCYVGPGAVLRGDFGPILLEAGSNIQETCVVHSFPNVEVVVGEAGHIGHGAILHGCRVGRNAMVGMNSVVMDGVTIGENSIVGALSFLKAGAVFGANCLILGIPAKEVRQLTPAELDWKRTGTAIYQQIARDAQHKLESCEPLIQKEPNRRSVEVTEHLPLYLERLKHGD